MRLCIPNEVYTKATHTEAGSHTHTHTRARAWSCALVPRRHAACRKGVHICITRGVGALQPSGGSASLHKLIMNKQTKIFINILHAVRERETKSERERERTRAFCTNNIFMHFFLSFNTPLSMQICSLRILEIAQAFVGRVCVAGQLAKRVSLAAVATTPQVLHLWP